jgi:D-alanyl-D-alanine carboxypeptidase/D-alanyl-D-alanine-endopeptidase (penicillin-binding protein 4)
MYMSRTKKRSWGLTLLAWFWAWLAHAQGLPVSVQRALDQARLPAQALHVVVAPAQGGAPALSFGAEQAVNPASLMKLITTSAALEMLGPTFTWRTPVWTDGELSGGVLRGNLYLQGRGDPKWVAERLWLLLRRIQAMGIVRIQGDVVLDQSAFDTPEVDPGAFDGEPTRPYNASPQALLINYKSVVLHWTVDPVQRVARLHIEPPMAGMRWAYELALSSGPCVDYRAKLKADFSDPNQWVFRGAYPSDCGERVWPVAYNDPATHAQRAVEGTWRAVGGQLDGQVRTGRVSAGARPLLSAESPSLAEVIRDINKYSNNLMAEQLFLTLSLQARGLGQPEASRLLLQRWWDENVGAPGLLIDNGSGLSRTGRVTAAGLATLLQRMWRGPYMPELLASLPISSQDGTLRRSQSLAQAHLKTGSLKNVLAVAGYVDAERGQRWVVVAIIEHPQAQNGRPVLDALIDAVAQSRTHQP